MITRNRGDIVRARDNLHRRSDIAMNPLKRVGSARLATRIALDASQQKPDAGTILNPDSTKLRPINILLLARLTLESSR
jgi:hypothetical protein